MSKELLKCLLDVEFFNTHKHRINTDVFVDKNIKSVYNTIATSHENNNTNLNIDELKALHYSYNPTITQSAKANLELFFTELQNVDISNAVGADLMQRHYLLGKFTELANLAMDGGDNKPVDMSLLDKLVDGIKGVESNTDSFVAEDTDLDALLQESTKEFRFKTPLPALNEILGGFGGGVFIVVAARPNAGKTAFCVSMMFQPGGLVDQGAKVHYIGNEEKVFRTILRSASAYTGMTKQEITDHKDVARAKWAEVKDKATFIDAVAMDLTELENYVKMNDIDVLFVDQLDKIRVKGSYANEADRLRTLYTCTRELAKKHDICIVGLCQASNDAEGQLTFGFESLENSKTGKAAECDVCICIGKEKFTGEDTGYRFLNIVKNKPTGIEKSMGVVLDRYLARISV